MPQMHTGHSYNHHLIFHVIKMRDSNNLAFSRSRPRKGGPIPQSLPSAFCLEMNTEHSMISLIFKFTMELIKGEHSVNVCMLYC